jgi:hypothetical protein
VNRPQVAGGLSARYYSSRCSSCSTQVLVSLRFDPSSRWFSFGGSWPDSPPGVAGQSARLEPSVVLVRTVRYSR